MTNHLLRNKIILRTVIAAVCASFASGCATDPATGQPSLKETFASDDPCSQNARNIGIGIGVLAGAILGKQIDNSNKGLLVGAALGGTIGGLIGNDIDRRRCELSKIAKQYNLDMQVSALNAAGAVIGATPTTDNSGQKQDPVGSIVEIRDLAGAGGHFESNSDKLTARAQQYFAAIAETYTSKNTAAQIQDPKLKAEYLAQVQRRKILLVGHTDDTGSSRLNADLSERRARAVSHFMEEHGVPKASLYFQGAGEFYPVADNHTEEGRAKNRRVEIVEASDQTGFDNFLGSRKPRYEFYRAKDDAPAALPVPSAVTRATPQATPSQVKPEPTRANNKVATKAVTTPAPRTDTGVTVPVANAGKVTSIPVPRVGDRQENFIDFGGVPLSSTSSVVNIGKVELKKPFFSLISAAYADEPAVIADCTRDRPRAVNGVKALSDGKTYKTSEHIPGLYGKTWTDQVNGHQIVINKVAVLSNDGSLANPPEFKVYTNYDSSKSRTAKPDLILKPDVNTYLGSNGLLYRMFINGKAGVDCVDIVFENNGGTAAKAGKLVYIHATKPYVAEFRPKMYR